MMQRFDVYWVALDPTTGSEIKKTRPCLIISHNLMNQMLDRVIVAPLTSKILDLPFRTTVKIGGKTSSVAFDQMRAVSKERVSNKKGHISKIEQDKVLLILHKMFAP